MNRPLTHPSSRGRIGRPPDLSVETDPPWSLCVLADYFTTEDPLLANALLTTLVDTLVRPTVLRAVHIKVGAAHLLQEVQEDICQTAIVSVIERLRAGRDASAAPILNLKGYCVSVAVNACRAELRVRGAHRKSTMNEEPDPEEWDVGPALSLSICWGAVCCLPLRYRSALILGLRCPAGGPDKEFGGLILASEFDIARALEIDPEAFRSTILPSLPWPDERIGVFLGVNRSQVSNLRSAARRRLRKRLAAIGVGG